MAYAMAGGTPQHVQLAMQLGSALVGLARPGRGRCRVHSSDARIYVVVASNSYHPDLSVVCVAEAVALENALLPHEREEFHQSQRSRAALHRLVVDAALHGEVELVAFWAGEQAAPLVRFEARDAAWLIDHLVPFVAGTKYLVPARGLATPRA
jgi:hypothetical protein